MALQTREQHIKREKATSNICTAQALLASMAGMFAVYNGPEGILRIALNAHSHAVAAANALGNLGYNITSTDFFDTIEIEAEAERILELATAAGINFFYPSPERVRISFDELSTVDEVNKVIGIFAAANGKGQASMDSAEEKIAFDSKFRRESEYLTQSIFNKYHSETELMRYIKKLERRDISLANSMIPLGSCTMKLNSAVSMMPLSLSAFGNIHPFCPLDQAEGYLAIIHNLEKYLAEITGFDAVSLQPNSGANGEYAGLMVVRAYHASRGQDYRNIALIPASAHGTNPASATMAGMKVVVVATDANGNVDIDDLRAKAAEYSKELACLIITYPSTHGVFEGKIKEMMDVIHENGGQVYLDGANMNAMVGLSSPGFIGADVCHLNLHKSFGIPHGGGGPGVGPIGVAAHLARFLPSHSLVGTGGVDGITAVSAAPWGSPLVLPITYAYIRMLGAEGLRKSSEMAILNANYIATALSGEFSVVYTGETGRVGHEMILDCRRFRADYGVETGDIARRLMDYGFHAPTLSFPVHDTLMVEPTESEPKAELDRFVAAMKQIKVECDDIAAGNADPKDNLIVMAPHTAAEVTGDEWAHPYSRQRAAFPLPWIVENKFWPYVTKIDGGYGDRNLFCTCDSLESYL